MYLEKKIKLHPLKKTSLICVLARYIFGFKTFYYRKLPLKNTVDTLKGPDGRLL
jgi:hypothetical protein